MGLVVVDTQVQTTYTGTSTLVTKPTGLAVGNLMLAHGAGRDSNFTFTPPAGWTELDKSSDGDVVTYLWYKVAVAGDVAGANFDFVSNQSGRERFAAVTSIRGTLKTDPLSPDTDTNGSGNTITIGTITPDQEKHMVFLFAANAEESLTFDSFSIATDDPSWTTVYNTSYGGSRDGNRFYAYGARDSVNATGNATINLSGSLSYGAQMVVVNEGLAGGGAFLLSLI